METKEKICVHAKKEFLEKGFESASLRNIARQAEVSTGAIYGYFKDKEDLFCSIVEGPAEEFREILQAHEEEFFSQSPQTQYVEMGLEGDPTAEKMVTYMYKHLDAFRLISSHSKGTKYENYFDRIVEMEENGTCRYLESMEAEGYLKSKPDKIFVHLLSESTIMTMVSLIDHNVPEKKATEYARTMQFFFSNGWRGILFHQKD